MKATGGHIISKYKMNRVMLYIGIIWLVVFVQLKSFSQAVISTGDFTSGSVPSGWTASGLGFNQWGCGNSVYLIQSTNDYVQSPAITFTSGVTYSIYITASCQTASPNVLINGTTVISGAALNTSISFTPSSSYTNANLKIIPVSNNAVGIQKVQISTQTSVSVSSTSLTGFTSCTGGGSNYQSFTVSGTGLTSNITLSSPTNYEISTNSTSGYSSSITLTQSGGGVSNTNIYVRLKSSNSAGTYNSQNISITSTGATTQNVSCSGVVNALPTISGTLNTCIGFTTTLTGSGTAGGTPWLSASTGVATVNGSGVVSGVAAGTSLITYTNNLGCSNTATVTVNTRPSAATLSGSSTICNGNTANLSVAITGGASPYSVVYSGGTVNSYTSGSAISVSPNTTTSYSLTSVTDANGCTVASPSGIPTVTVNASPVPSFSTQPGASSCQNVDVTYTTQSGQTNYSWTISGVLNTDYSITSGSISSSSNTVTLKWLTTGSKTVSINYSNGTCSAASPTSSTATTINSTSLSAPGSISGSSTVIQGQTGVAYSVGAVANATSYTWSLPSNASITLGSGTNSITVTYASNATTGNVSVTASNVCVTSASSPNFTVTVAPLLTAASSPTVDNNFDITFSENANWRNAISSITVDGTTLSASAYNKNNAGKITFIPSSSNPTNLLQQSGTKNIVIIATGYSSTSVSQSISAGTASKLALQTQPIAQAGYVATVFSTQPVVLIQDQYGNTSQSTANVTANVGAGSWTLGGTNTKAGVGGIVSFTNLTTTCLSAITGATIAFSSSGLASVSTNSFTIPYAVPRELYYNNSSGGNWSTLANWKVGSCNSGTTATSLPNSTDNVYLSCNTNTTITLDVTANCNNLTIANGVTLSVGNYNLTLAGDLICNNGSKGSLSWGTGTVTVSGNVTFGTNSDQGTINSGSGYLVMDGTSKALTIAKDITLQNFKLASNSISVATGSYTLTISGVFDFNNKTGFTHTSGKISLTGTTLNSSSVVMGYFGTPTFEYKGGGIIAPGSYYNLTTSNTQVSIACGTTVNVNNAFNNTTTIVGPISSSGWAKIDNNIPISNSGTIGSSSTYLYVSGTIAVGGSIGGNSGVNVVQNSTQSANCSSLPTINANASLIENISYCYGSGPSTANTVIVSGAKLSGDITITAPANFEISSNGSSYSNSLTLTKSGSTPDAYVSATTIYVRLKASLSVAAYGPSNITLASNGASPQSISISGEVKIVPTATATSNSPVYNVGVLNLAAGPSNMFTYGWSGPNSFSSNFQNPSIVNPITSGTYVLTVTNSVGCTATASTSVIVNTAKNYYSKSSGYLNLTSSWGENTDGSGSNPADFATAGQIFNIRNNATPTLNADWTVSGNGAKVIVGNGSTPCGFTIPAGSSFTGTIDVANYGTLTITNPITSGITLGLLGSGISGSNGSSVVYSSTSSQNVKSANYFDVTINGNSVLPNSTTVGSVLVSNTLNVSGSPTVTNSTIVFCGTGSQNIPSMTYYNLETQLGGTKTLLGDINVGGILRVGNITTFNASNKIITFNGTGGKKRIVATGKFVPSTSTVIYSVANDTVSAVNYNNLTLGNVNGVYESTDVIGISGVFTPGSGTWIKTGSSIVFNGTSNQTLPAITYNNLKINNSSGISLSSGTTTITGILTLSSGIVSTGGNNLYITNTSVDAVSIGSTSSFVNGRIRRYLPLPSTLTSNAIYFFPVGSGTTYLPFSLNNISTNTSGTYIDVIATASNPGGTYGTGLSTSSSPSEYWTVTHNNNLTARVTLGKQSAITSNSVIGHSSTGYNGTYNSIGGTANTTNKTVSNSQITTFSDFIIAPSSATSVTYYYDGTGDLNSVLNWGINTDGSGTNPANFSTDNATYELRNTASVTLSSNWTISGANTILRVGNGTNATSLTIASGATFQTSGSIETTCNSTLNLFDNSNLVVYGNYTTSGSCSNSTPNILNNSGVLSVFGTFTQVASTYSYINNYSNGIMNIYNDYSKNEHTWFNNYGNLNITNGNFNSTGNNENFFYNKDGGKVVIDNSGAPSKADNLTNIYLDEGLVLEAGSVFSLIKTNLNVTGGGGAPHDLTTIAGQLSIKDGNFDFRAGGGKIKVSSTGSVYVYDTDNSGDGVLNMSYGGGALTVEGIVYAEGVSITSGGGTSVSVNNGGNMFIGNIGLYTGSNNNDMIVYSGGTLNFCGNKTAGADNLGTINAGGTLNYASGYYTTQTPGGQSDFIVGGTQVAAFSNAESCLAAFDNGVSSALPIIMDDFDVRRDGETVAVLWSTLAEVNNDFFTVLHSLDAQTFNEIADISGAGTSSIKHHYLIIDDNPQGGINYYKIRQTDFDGNAVFSPTKSVKIEKKSLKLKIYPNPGKIENIQLMLYSELNTEVSIVVTDILGKIIVNHTAGITKGDNIIELYDFADLNVGTYWILIQNNNEIIESHKLIIE